jgi:hypothetical protein
MPGETLYIVDPQANPDRNVFHISSKCSALTATQPSVFAGCVVRGEAVYKDGVEVGKICAKCQLRDWVADQRKPAEKPVEVRVVHRDEGAEDRLTDLEDRVYDLEMALERLNNTRDRSRR